MVLFAALAITLLAGCGPDYGGAQNHMHDLLALRGTPQTVLVASHIGLYRSTDAGEHWDEVAGGGGQLMDGLMLYKLAQSPVEAKRVYVLAIPRPDDPSAAKGTPGIYTSDDAGATWKLAASVSSLPAQSVYTIATGPGSAARLFALLDGKGGRILAASDDAGAHWRTLPALPASDASGVLSDPAHAGRLLLYSLSAGLFASDDAGAHWGSVQGIQGGVFSASFAASGTVYALGDMGVYLSHDDGRTFALVNKDAILSAVVASPADASHAYALTSSVVFATGDGGTTWKRAATTDRHPTTLAVDPSDAARAYVSVSAPIGVEQTTDSGGHWRQILP
jgi:photosystem II stability/assembly factor-like uncharacterized protein